MRTGNVDRIWAAGFLRLFIAREADVFPAMNAARCIAVQRI